MAYSEEVPLKVNGSHTLICAAIDFGTTFSRIGFQFKCDYNHYRQNPKHILVKPWKNGLDETPTTILIQPDGKTFEAFGYEAEDKYAELVKEGNGQHKDWYYFSRFKMMLYDNMKLKRGMYLEASNGKQLPAIDVYAAAIRYLKEDTMEYFNQENGLRFDDDGVLWVLTVPAIWTGAAKQFMREAGRKAGIKDKNLILVLDPEAACICYKYDSLQKHTYTKASSFKPGTKYIVLDAGGGTLDITAHEILPDGNIKELHRPCNGYWDGTTVDTNFIQFLKEVLGPAVFCGEARDDYVDLCRMFKITKQRVSMNNNKYVSFLISSKLALAYLNKTGRNVNEAVKHSKYVNNDSVSMLIGNRLRVGSDIMKGFFDEALTHIVSQIGELLKDDYVKTCDTLLLVGGFSESPIIQEALSKEFPHVRIINPSDPSMVVLKGAVLFGRHQTIISERICRFTYGHQISLPFEDGDPEEYAVFDGASIKVCQNRFRAIVLRDTVLKTTEKQFSSRTCKPPLGKSYFYIDLYKSPKTHPRYVTEPDCELIGRVHMDYIEESDKRCLVGGNSAGQKYK